MGLPNNNLSAEFILDATRTLASLEDVTARLGEVNEYLTRSLALLHEMETAQMNGAVTNEQVQAYDALTTAIGRATEQQQLLIAGQEQLMAGNPVSIRGQLIAPPDLTPNPNMVDDLRQAQMAGLTAEEQANIAVTERLTAVTQGHEQAVLADTAAINEMIAVENAEQEVRRATVAEVSASEGAIQEAGDLFRREVDSMKVLLTSLATEGGQSARDFAQSIRALNADPAVLSAALREMPELFMQVGNTGDVTAQALQAAYAEVSATIDGLKVRIREMVAGGMPLDRVGATLKTSLTKGSAEAKLLTQAIREIRNETMAVEQTGTQTWGTFRQQVDLAKQAIQQLMTEQNATLQQAAAALKTNLPVGVTAPALGQANKEIAQQTGLLGQLRIAWTNAGQTIAQYITGTMFFSLIGLFAQLSQKIGEAIKAGLEWEQALIRLNVSLRALQREGVKITTQEVTKLIDKLVELYPMFSRKELESGTAGVLYFARGLKLTTEQLDATMQAFIALAQLNPDKTFEDIADGVMRFVKSGYNEGVQRLGLGITQTDVRNKAMEMGFQKTFDTLDSATQSAVRLAIALEKVKDVQEDATKIQDTMAGKSKTVESQWATMWAAMGRILLPLWVNIQELAFSVVTAIMTIISFAGTLLTLFTVAFTAQHAAVDAFTKSIKNGEGIIVASLKWTLAYLNDIHIKINDIIDSWRNLVGLPPIGNSLNGDVQQGTTSGGKSPDERDVKALTEEEAQLVMEMEKKIAEIRYNAQKEQEKALEEHYQKEAEIVKDYNRDMEKIILDHERKLADIERDYLRDKEKAEQDYLLNIAKAEQDLANRIAAATQKYHDKEYEEEQKFQLQMKNLRLDFLDDLDGAIQKRDAREALNLIKKYNRDKQKATDSYKLEQEARKRAFEQELRDLAIQNAQKMIDMRIDFQNRMAELALQNAQKKADEDLNYQQEIKDRNDRLAQTLADLDKALADQQAAIEKSIQDKINAMADGYIIEQKITTDNAKKIYDALYGYYGPNGYIENLYKYMLINAQNYAKLIGDANNSMIPGQPPVDTTGTDTDAVDANIKKLGKRAGVDIATSLSLAGLANSGRLSATSTISSRNSGSLGIKIMLSPDLEARIVENSISSIGDIMMQVQRES